MTQEAMFHLIPSSPSSNLSDIAAAVRIRQATAADSAQLISMINAAYSVETFLEGTRTDDEQLAATMREGVILLAEDGSGRILACVYMEVRGRRGYLGQLAVDPAHQGRRLGRLIVEAAEQRLRQQGCEAVDIVVLSMSTQLPPLYRKFGYVETGIEPFHVARTLKPGVHCHCIAMSKQL